VELEWLSRAEGVAEVVEHLPSNYDAISSNPSTNPPKKVEWLPNNVNVLTVLNGTFQNGYFMLCYILQKIEKPNQTTTLDSQLKAI
jgi:hypothetical protein